MNRFASRSSFITDRLSLRLVFAASEDVEDDVEKQAAATEEHGGGKHKTSPYSVGRMIANEFGNS